jgi:hypothetical protein
MKNGTILRNSINNYFILKKGNNGEYYTALLLGHARITSWHREPLYKIKDKYVVVDDYDNEPKMLY